MLKYIIAAVLIALTWGAVLLLRLKLWIGLSVTGGIVAVVVVIFIVQLMRARRSAQSLERAISQQGDAHAKVVRPDQEAEIHALKGEFLRAVSALKSSRLGRGGLDALYALPWYVIIGPPGAGKSTAIRNSGLQFPYLSASGGAVRGIGGTRNCDWWLTNEAILLDTAGRYTSDDDDREEWFSFLDLLRTSRPKKPIDGILVAISIADIVNGDDDTICALGQRIRERVDEVMERVQVIVPIYILFTKCDLIDGFVEIFGDLKKPERGQIWGFTLPLAASGRPLGEVFLGYFDELLRAVKQRAGRRIGQERRREVREKIYEFPQQFELMRDQLARFVDALFVQNIYRESPMPRGVYFTSGTQEGRPIDRVMAAMAKAFGVAPKLAPTEPVTEAKSYFLRDAFHYVMFPDRGLAGHSRRETTRRNRRSLLVAAGVTAVSLVVAALPTFAYVRNRELIESTEAVVRAVAKHRKDDLGTPFSIDELEPLRRRVAELRDFERDGPPLRLRYGMYSGDALAPHVRWLYAEVVRQEVILPMLQQGIAELKVAAEAPQFDKLRTYELLKAHLLLTAPRGKGEPQLGGELTSWLGGRIAESWAASLGSAGATAEALEELRVHAGTYLALLADDPRLASVRDERLVHDVRIALASTTLEDLVVAPIIADLARDGYDVSLASILGATQTTIITKRVVRGAFTRRGWEEKVRARLAAAANGSEAWVLGREGGRSVKPAERLAALRSRYFELYIQEWQEFLESLSVKRSTSQLESLQILQDLTRGVPPPYGRLFRDVAANTKIEDPAASGAAKAGAALAGLASKAKPPGGRVGAAVLTAARGAGAGDAGGAPLLEVSDVAAAFADFTTFGVAPPAAAGEPPQQVDLDVYQEQLAFLRDGLKAKIENPGDAAEFPARLEAALTRTSALVEARALGWRPRFKALLEPPVDDSANSTKKGDAQLTALGWCEEVVKPFDATLKGRYPFAKNGHDAALADLATFYKPGGVLWKFYDAKLAARVLRVGNSFEFGGATGQGSGFLGELLTTLSRSSEISTVLFPPGAEAPLVEFEVRIRPAPGVASIGFEVDGQVIKTQNEPDRWHRFRWPGAGTAHNAVIKVKGAQNLSETIRQDGEWGLFRLLEQGRVQAPENSRMFSVTWTLTSRANVEIIIDIKPTRSEAPFFGTSRRDGRFLAPFRSPSVNPPHTIARGGNCFAPRVVSPR
ncbi:MAG: type VI secretion system membrane subunit TssM [Myxococcales bacterium]|nr:type VI secretion system membrane subunit TssM [Myxococcales bacterium]